MLDPLETYQAAIDDLPDEVMVFLLGSLDEGQKKKVVYPYAAPERIGWHFVPLETRKGVPLKEMTDAQREAARQLLAAALSESGYKKADSIMNREKLLEELENLDDVQKVAANFDMDMAELAKA